MPAASQLTSSQFLPGSGSGNVWRWPGEAQGLISNPKPKVSGSSPRDFQEIPMNKQKQQQNMSYWLPP